MILTQIHFAIIFYQIRTDLDVSKRGLGTEECDLSFWKLHHHSHHLKWQLAVSVVHPVRTNKAVGLEAGFSLPTEAEKKAETSECSGLICPTQLHLE